MASSDSDKAGAASSEERMRKESTVDGRKISGLSTQTSTVDRSQKTSVTSTMSSRKISTVDYSDAWFGGGKASKFVRGGRWSVAVVSGFDG